MKTLIFHNIISANTAHKINTFIKANEKSLGKVKVLFSALTESNRSWKVNKKINFDYKILHHKEIKLKGKDLFTYFINPSILKELHEFNPDRLIISGWDLFASQVSLFWGIKNKKHVTLWSGSTANETSWRRTITKPLVKWFVKKSTDFVAYGTRAKKYLISLGADSKKISIFPNDVDEKFFKDQTRIWQPERTKIKKQYKINCLQNFIFVGQLIKRKGLIDFLQAFSKFKETNPNWGFVIVGAGKHKKNIKNYIRQNKIKDVIFLGVINQKDLPKVYAVCDILVLPSVQEVWGRVVNEALYSGLKVLVSDKCGCAPDLVKKGKNGYVFKSDNINSLMVALNKVINLA